MHSALIFVSGLLIGSLFGIVSICLMQINRINGKEETDE
jgi:hypothetical protein